MACEMQFSVSLGKTSFHHLASFSIRSSLAGPFASLRCKAQGGTVAKAILIISDDNKSIAPTGF